MQAKHKPKRTPTSTVSTAPAEEAEPNQTEATPASTQQDMVTEMYEATPASTQQDMITEMYEATPASMQQDTLTETYENVFDEPVDTETFPEFDDEPMVE